MHKQFFMEQSTLARGQLINRYTIFLAQSIPWYHAQLRRTICRTLCIAIAAVCHAGSISPCYRQIRE